MSVGSRHTFSEKLPLSRMLSASESRILISGGGTGGHIYPAISIAEKLIEANKDFEILFVGARNKMEMKIIPKFGYKILGLWISGLNRNFFNFKSIIKNIFLPIKLSISIFQSILIINRFLFRLS